MTAELAEHLLALEVKHHPDGDLQAEEQGRDQQPDPHNPNPHNPNPHNPEPDPQPGLVTAILDIETASCPAWLMRSAPPDFALMDAGDQAAWILERAADGARSPLTGQVVCWAVALVLEDGTRGPVGSMVSRSLGAEKALLESLSAFLRGHETKRAVAHFGASFDFPFLRARATRHGLYRLARGFHQDKPWGARLIDTSEPSWCPRPPGGRNLTGWSVSGLAELFGIPRPPTLDGSKVPLAWFRGEYDPVEEHCLDDVLTLREIYFRLQASRSDK